jgi:hypothetical protein
VLRERRGTWILFFDAVGEDAKRGGPVVGNVPKARHPRIYAIIGIVLLTFG